MSWKLDGSDSPASTQVDENKPKQARFRRIDFLGSTTLALTIVGFLLVLDIGGQRLPWIHPLVWIIFAAACGFTILFVLIEAYVAREPIFPLRLIVHRDVITTYVVTALQGAAQFAVHLTLLENLCVGSMTG